MALPDPGVLAQQEEESKLDGESQSNLPEYESLLLPQHLLAAERGTPIAYERDQERLRAAQCEYQMEGLSELQSDATQPAHVLDDALDELYFPPARDRASRKTEMTWKEEASEVVTGRKIRRSLGSEIDTSTARGAHIMEKR